MDCPACGHVLTPETVGDLTADVCEGGCAGIWLDNSELEKVDERHESSGEALLDIEGDPDARPSDGQQHECPKCGDYVMYRYFFTVKREIEVDECPNCAGVWLDGGELGALRRQFEDEEARDQAAREEYQRLFGEQLDRMREESRDDLRRARAFANAMRLVLPSYWIPGDQDWGAY